MKTLSVRISFLLASVVTLLLLSLSAVTAHATTAPGITGPTFNLTASSGYITTPDGDSLMVWGYGISGGLMQYPGPTLIVNQGDTVTVNFTSNLTSGGTAVASSILFPGQTDVKTTDGLGNETGLPGLLTRESDGTSTVTYTFTAGKPGTYMYHSGTNMQLQMEMGLFGAIIVRPQVAGQAYNSAATAYDREYLFVLSEMDPVVHYAMSDRDAGLSTPVDNTQYAPKLWFINGRNGPDTLAGPNLPWLPNQPYDALARVHMGETALVRVVSASRDQHPFHTHGNHYRLIARDGNMLESAPGMGPDLSHEDYTLQTVPGSTHDLLWRWTGEKLGWDVLGTTDGHTCNDGNGDSFDDITREYCPDHGKPLPVTMPNQQDLTFGGFYSGSPFLGAFGDLPPGEGGLNAYAGMFYMWHSHSERELTNNDIFPGGMMTMMVVEAPGVPIE